MIHFTGEVFSSSKDSGYTDRIQEGIVEIIDGQSESDG